MGVVGGRYQIKRGFRGTIGDTGSIAAFKLSFSE
jgi:hypothetical protein